MSTSIADPTPESAASLVARVASVLAELRELAAADGIDDLLGGGCGDRIVKGRPSFLRVSEMVVEVSDHLLENRRARVDAINEGLSEARRDVG